MHSHVVVLHDVVQACRSTEGEKNTTIKMRTENNSSLYQDVNALLYSGVCNIKVLL